MFWRKVCCGLTCREERGHIYEVAAKNHILKDQMTIHLIQKLDQEALRPCNKRKTMGASW